MSFSSLRAVFRTTEAFHFPNSFSIINPTHQFQGYKCYHSISQIRKQAVKKGVFGPMDWHKKRKTGTLVWRQISTQSRPDKECSTNAAVTEPGNIASIEEGTVKTDEAEETVVSSSSTDALKDSENKSGDSSTTSVSQNIVGSQEDSENTTLSEKKHAVSVEVGMSIMRFIKGTKGSTQKDIEAMGVKINFPPYKKGDTIVIESDSMDDIVKASQKIQSIIDEAVNSPNLPYSHFISLPLAIHPEFVDKVTRFQSSILGYDPTKDVKGITESSDGNSKTDTSVDAAKVDQPENKDLTTIGVIPKTEDAIDPPKMGIRDIPTVSYAPKSEKTTTLYDLRIDDSIFLKPQRLHLTVLMLKLWNKERLHAAAEVLQGIHPKIHEVLGNRPLFVRLKGVAILRGSKEKAQVLYAPIEEIGDDGRLTRACHIIAEAYMKAGLVLEKDANQKLKLHATLMNTTFRRGRKNKRGDSFDARGIFKQFETEEWGKYHIREAHLSQRFSYDDNGYYHCCAVIPFPETSDVPEDSVESARAELEETRMADTA